MSGLEIAGLAIAGATLTSSVFSRIRGNSYQVVPTTFKGSSGEMTTTRIASTKGDAYASVSSNGDLTARSWDGGEALGVLAFDYKGSWSEITKEPRKR
ncbi:hypothetical protein B0T26DRAFT_751179 [Lasiosphaeria miniovina]|uniref:Uncharacterized protein n=1 Tax=Lasiosphaeria miniovina TaxID=1954250 RepID=A0AA40AJS4_9PEZI|nr:uncharacterized protein B0T26DRAFT_751179 [Lasiosphaeria miniovina]KAK0717070.1 hypothetical protein B0T26DRAFT_751179 [Lasiosphaeria miniovina]